MLNRRAALLLPLFAAACSSTPPRVFAPLRYDYLDPILLDVGQLDIDDRWRPIGANDVGAQSPAPPVPSLVAMARDRLKPAGGAGRAVFTITNASIIRADDTLIGNFSVRVDVVDADGKAQAFAEARVARTRAGLGSRSEFPGLLYDFVKAMMDSMNVELEYQIRRQFGKLLLGAPGATLPAPVQQEALPGPR